MPRATIHCPACGASNPGSASWCLQCFTAFDDAEEESGTGEPGGDDQPPGAAAEPPQEQEPVAVRTPGVPGDETASATSTPSHDRFRTTEEGVDWRCVVCESWNPIERQTCSTCQAPFSQSFGEEEPPPDVDETTALIATAVLPGAGHFLAGRTGAGISRAFIFIVWLAGGWLLLSSASSSGQSTLPAFPLLLGALVVWVGSILDTRTAVRGGSSDTELLRPRVFLWVVVGVIGLLMLTFGTSAMSLP